MTSKLASIALALAVGFTGLVATAPAASAASVTITTDHYRGHPVYRGRRHEVRRDRRHIRKLRRELRRERRHIRHERRHDRHHNYRRPHVLYRVN